MSTFLYLLSIVLIIVIIKNLFKKPITNKVIKENNKPLKDYPKTKNKWLNSTDNFDKIEKDTTHNKT